MRKLLIMPLLMAGAMFSCGQVSTENRESTPADEMFQELQALTERYCDSMRAAKDSAEVMALTERYEAAHQRINEKYPPMTDMSLTEGQNDTLATLTMQLTHLRSQKLQPAAPTDSIPAEDTVEE